MRFAFQTMVMIGSLLALLGVVYVAIWFRLRRLPKSRWFYRGLVAAGPLSIVALLRSHGFSAGSRGPPSSFPSPMSLAEVPIVVVLAGLAAYAILAGADFGAGFWQLTPGSSSRAKAIRAHAHHAIGPVWEANHVWLIFVLVVCWTAYPRAFGSIASTLAVPLFIAGIGIVLRGTAYSLRAATETADEQRRVEVAFAASSILTPFALGAVIGAVASGRVPVGNAKGELFGSWLNPTSVAIGAIAVATAAYLAAVYLAADAARLGRPELERAFRVRALIMAAVAGAVALGSLAVVRDDAPHIWDGLTSGAGLGAVIVSALAGGATVVLVAARHYTRARLTAALAVVAVIAGWGFAHRS